MASIHRMRRSPFWYCAFYLPDGTRALRSTGTSEKRKATAICLKWDEASRVAREGRLTEARARDVLSDIFVIANQDKLPSGTVNEYLTAWLSKKRLEIADRSFSDYGKAVRELQANLGAKVNKPMDALTSRDVVSFRAALSNRVRGATVNKYLKILRGAWTSALKDGLVRENIFARVGMVKESKTARRAFTLPELKTIIEACNPEWRGMVFFGLYTGQRLSDIASLTWRQVDVDRKELKLTTEKTSRPMNIPLAAPLVNHIMAMPSADDPDAALFPDAARTVNVNQSTLSRQFNDILASVGLVEKKTHEKKGKGRDSRHRSGGLSFHCLRHTATSLLKNAGVSDVVAREIIGHESEAVSRAYTHIEAATLREAVNKLPDVIGAN